MDREIFAVEVLQCVERGLDAHGPSIKHNVYWKLLTEFNMRPTDIVDNPKMFVQVLDTMFGAGAVLIERTIAKELISRFEISMSTSRISKALRVAKESYSLEAPMITS